MAYPVSTRFDLAHDSQVVCDALADVTKGTTNVAILDDLMIGTPSPSPKVLATRGWRGRTVRRATRPVTCHLDRQIVVGPHRR